MTTRSSRTRKQIEHELFEFQLIERRDRHREWLVRRAVFLAIAVMLILIAVYSGLRGAWPASSVASCCSLAVIRCIRDEGRP